MDGRTTRAWNTPGGSQQKSCVVGLGCHPGVPTSRLFCFPPAGGGASFFGSWPRLFPESVQICAVQLPGREDRYHEPPASSQGDAVALIVRDIQGVLDLPFAFFGHSMGAVLALELAHCLRSRGLPGPFHLFVSGCAGPKELSDPSFSLFQGDPHREVSDAELLAAFANLGGIPQVILREPTMLARVLATLRADLRLRTSPAGVSRTPLDCPVTALAGADDPWASPKQMQAWEEQTRGRFQLQVLPGGHFFVNNALPKVIETIIVSYALLGHGRPAC